MDITEEDKKLLMAFKALAVKPKADSPEDLTEMVKGIQLAKGNACDYEFTPTKALYILWRHRCFNERGSNL